MKLIVAHTSSAVVRGAASLAVDDAAEDAGVVEELIVGWALSADVGSRAGGAAVDIAADASAIAQGVARDALRADIVGAISTACECAGYIALACDSIEGPTSTNRAEVDLAAGGASSDVAEDAGGIS